MSSRSPRVVDYYRRLTEVEIGEVARALLGDRVRHTGPRVLECDCPHHASKSKKSLNILLDKQGWYCFGCGVGGDVLQLVEFVQSGNRTVGQTGPMPESHRAARDYLARGARLPRLSEYGLSPGDVAAAEADWIQEVQVQGVLTRAAHLYHDRLLASPEILDWFHKKYGIGDELMEALKIGYAADGPWVDVHGEKHPGVVDELTAGDEDITVRDLAASGAFRPMPQDSVTPFFQNRLIFPYWSRGRVVFMIGRRTRWTPDEPWERCKYKKLPVHDDDVHSHIAPCIDNSYLYNEDCLLVGPDRVVLTEGVTDCISLMQHGFPAVSPVTVRIRGEDWNRIIPRLSGLRTLYVCQDNEVSEVGLNGALETARGLQARQIDTRVVILPLGEDQQAAREELRQRFGITAAMAPTEVRGRLEGRSELESQEADRLQARAKIDVNEYFAAGHTAEEFEALLAEAKTPLEIAIEELPAEGPELERRLEIVLREISQLDAVKRERHVRVVHAQVGGAGPSLAVLKTRVREMVKEHRAQERKDRRKKRRRGDAPIGSCRATVDDVVAEMEERTGSPDYDAVAEVVYEWLGKNGAKFFRTQHGEPFLFFESELLWMDSSDRHRKRHYFSRLYGLTGVNPVTQAGHVLYEALANLAAVRGEVRDQLSWLHTDVSHRTVYFNLNNADHEIVKITPEGVTILKNGGNEDGVILASSHKVQPIRYQEDVDPDEADTLLGRLLRDNLACSPQDAMLIDLWVACFLLIDFAGTKPMTRFEGPSGSGKTTASKLATAILYGEPQQKKSTDAANYTDGSQNPLIALDNIEAKQMTEELLTFMLTSITGIAKEKRKAGTDAETVIERTKCLLNTTGIEPLGGELSEILSRSFVIEFDPKRTAGGCFLEAKVLAEIGEQRDLILSGLMKRTSQVLALTACGAQEGMMGLLATALGDHDKRRCNDFLSLMYLMLVVRGEIGDRDGALAELHPRFGALVESLNATTQITARESNPIATGLATLFKAYRTARDMDESRLEEHGLTQVERFRERYQLTFAAEDTIEGVRARDLFIALKRLAREFNLSFPMRSVQQFAQRFTNDLETIEGLGFTITVHEHRSRVRTYDIRLETDRRTQQDLPL